MMKRLRFDFSFARKLTDEEKKKIEDIVNRAINDGLEVKRETMPLSQALSQGALAFFKEKYPESISVYTILTHKLAKFSRKKSAAGRIRKTQKR